MKKNIIFILIAITVLIIAILLTRFSLIKHQENNMINKLTPVDNLNNENIESEIIQEEIIDSSKIGTLTIPKINLYDIDICESVELETLSYAIGHFENTSIYEGNIGLASHNAGTNANYFANINKLNMGDEIYYTTKYGTKKYLVNDIQQISSYDWSKLESSDKNMITLITCISGVPDMRLCVQGFEIK